MPFHHYQTERKDDRPTIPNIAKPVAYAPKPPVQNTSNVTVIKQKPFNPIKVEQTGNNCYFYDYNDQKAVDLTFKQGFPNTVDDWDSENDEELDWQKVNTVYHSERVQVKPPDVSWEEIKTTVKGINDINKPIDPIKQFSIPKVSSPRASS